MNEREFELQTADGVTVAASELAPASARSTSDAVVVIAPALGVPRSFYARFARWLADAGHRALTFDYRGIGGSRPRGGGGLRAFEGTLSDWGRYDLAAALGWARQQGGRCLLVGHSVAGQLLPLLPDPQAFDAAVFAASTRGDYRLWPLPYRLILMAHFEAALRLLPPLLGHFPGRLLGGEAVPPGVAREWSLWARTPGYLLGVHPELRAAAQQVRAPLLFFSFADDQMGAARAVDELASWYSAAPVERRHVAPADVGVEAIGHFGFFSSKAEPLWRECVRFLGL